MADLVRSLVRETGLREYDIVRIMSRAPSMYKTYTIPKRTGGLREISQPAREVKFVQRALIKVLIEKLPVHPAATAYRKGASIRQNVEPHAKNGPILKVDLKNFFPSIRSRDWVSYCEENHLDLDANEVYLSARLLFFKRKGARNLTLAIGAPSSPMLSNVLMYKFDEAIIAFFENDKISYTRYADDLTFSAPRTGYLNGVLKTVSQAIRHIKYPKLDINSKKTTYVTKKYSRNVTGLTIANDGRITIGRENKRKLSAAVHSVKMGLASPERQQVIAGMLAYVNSVEPEFISVLRKKYGDGVVSDLQKAVQIGHKIESHLPVMARTVNSQLEQLFGED
ncbi:MAG: retron St85 family RNA-directed DNA polymerase [Caulobacteraceae bacterium]